MSRAMQMCIDTVCPRLGMDLSHRGLEVIRQLHRDVMHSSEISGSGRTVPERASWTCWNFRVCHGVARSVPAFDIFE